MRKVLRWSRENVVEAILGCRRDRGVPQFITEFAGVRFVYDGEPAVVMKCSYGFGNFPDTVIFVGVPEEVIEKLERERRDWEVLLREYAPEKLSEAQTYGIYIKKPRLPRIKI